jgi:1-deoxy-D-xylulose-5-phosphate synthase
MSIAANVGSTARYLGKLLANPRYNRWKTSVEDAAKRLKLGWLRRVYYRLEETIKGWFLRSVIFEEFGLRYIGPIDGHDMHSLLDAMTIARNYPKPIVLHVSTQKGKGYPPAESHPEKWHGTSGFDVTTGEALSKVKSTTYSEVFGSTLERLAQDDDRIVAITAAMRAGTGLTQFAKQFPRRFFDVGICEEHAAVFAAGLAAEGLRPFFAVYSTFSQRAVDCIVHDICLQRLPVILCLDRAGIVGDDGPTHHGVFDIPMLRPIPGLVCVQPKDEAQLANLLYSAIKWDKPVVIRYPRGAGPGAALPESFSEVEMGKAEVLSPAMDCDVWIWALGDMLPLAEEAVTLLAEKNIRAGVVNALFIRPLDTQLLENQCSSAKLIATIENGVLAGGFGSAVAESLGRMGFHGPALHFGWPDQFIPHGKSEDLMEEFGLTGRAIARKISSALGSRT